MKGLKQDLAQQKLALRIAIPAINTKTTTWAQIAAMDLPQLILPLLVMAWKMHGNRENMEHKYSGFPTAISTLRRV
jgi:hypothetical protein